MRTILIIHSEMKVAETIARTLEEELDCQTVIAYRQKEAIGVLINKKFDLIVTDTFSIRPFNSTKTDGDRWRWLDNVRTIAEETPILAITPYTRHYYGEYRWQDSLTLLSSPFKRDELIEASLRALATEKKIATSKIYDNLNPSSSLV
jgi:DNA-binding NtrC family response regulator